MSYDLPDIKQFTDKAGYTKSLNPSARYNYSLCDDSKLNQWILSIEVFRQGNRKVFHQKNKLPYSDELEYAKQYELGKTILERQFPVKFGRAYSCPYFSCPAWYQPENETWDHIKDWHTDCKKIPLDKQTVEQRSKDNYTETMELNGQTADEIKNNNNNILDRGHEEHSNKSLGPFYCYRCNINCASNYDLNKHLDTKKHSSDLGKKICNKVQATAEINLRKRNKLRGRYSCSYCNIRCGDSYALNRHLATQSHSVNSNKINNNKRIKLDK